MQTPEERGCRVLVLSVGLGSLEKRQVVLTEPFQLLVYSLFWQVVGKSRELNKWVVM